MDIRDEPQPGDKLVGQVKMESIRSGYYPVELMTGRGQVSCRFYAVEGAHLGAVWVGGIGGDWDSPARGLYPDLCGQLRAYGIASLRVRFRNPTSLSESIYDVTAGIEFLQDNEVSEMALTGHSLGGAVIIQAAANSDAVKTVVTLSTQGYGADEVADLAPDCSILLIHGADDKVLPSYSSQHVYEMAHEPKEFIIFPGNGHGLERSAKEIHEVVRDWIIAELGA